MSDATFWLIARGAGIAAYVTLWLSVVAGLTLSTKTLSARLRPHVVTEIHRTLALSGIVLVLVHVLALVADAKVHVPLLSLVVPGLVDYRGVWTALGTAAFDAMLALHVSYRLRKYIGARRWRSLHYLSFGIFALAAVHGLAAGTDTPMAWMQYLYITSVTSVIGLTTFRALGAKRNAPRRKPPQPNRPATPTQGAPR